MIDPTNLYCATAVDGELEARVCSIVDSVTGAENEAVNCSPEFGSPGPPIPRAFGRIDEISYDGVSTEYELDPSTGLFKVKMMTAEYLELVDLFYLQGNPFPQGIPATAYDKPSLMHSASPRDGVCTDGETWKGTRIAPAETRTGSAPVNCHAGLQQ